jgi:acyl carrier protein
MATYADCLAVVHEVIQPHLKKPTVVDEDAKLIGELGLSSLQVLEFIAEIEDRLDVMLPLNDLPDITTVREFTEMLVKVTEAGDS